MPARIKKRPTVACGIAAVLAAMAALVVAPAAMAAGDEVKSGSYRLGLSSGFAEQLRSSGVKMTPKTFSIAEGSINPLTGGGEVRLKGKLRFKHGGERAVFRRLTAILPADGEGGFLKGQGRRRFGLPADNPTKLFSLQGGNVTRDGFGARIRGIDARFLPKAATRVNRKLSLDSLRRAKAGSVSIREQPNTVEVTGGTAIVTPNPNRSNGSGTIASKLDDHCIPFISGSSAVLPGVKDDSDVTNPFYVYPVSGGTVGPQADAGEVELSGGLKLQNSRTSGELGNSMTPCRNAPFPPVASLQQTEFKYNLLDSYLSSHIVVGGEHPPPLGGDRGEGIGSNLDLSNATVSADPGAHTVTIQGIVIRINKGGALNLNSVFQQSPATTFDVADQFVAGDLNGTASLSLTTR